MRSAQPLVLAGLASLLSSCGPSITEEDAGSGDGGTADASPPDAPVTTACVITVTGAATGSLPCTATAGKRDEDDFSIVSAMSSAASGSISQAAITIFLPGEVTVGTHAAGTFRTAAAMLTTTGAQTFVASLGAGPDQGSFGELRLDELVSLSSDGGMKIWTPHGSTTATLVGTTSGGTVMISVTLE